MIVMPSNNSKLEVGYLAGRFPGRIGHLLGPGAARGPYTLPGIGLLFPYCLDNGRFSAWDMARNLFYPGNWNEAAWLRLLDWAAAQEHKPRWALVPDVPGNAAATLESFRRYNVEITSRGLRTAFAVQDGMRPTDVPSRNLQQVIFIGGSTRWKWNGVESWCARFPHVHVGRVNTFHGLWKCFDAGAASVDGTGWFRGDQKQLARLIKFLRGIRPAKQCALFPELNAGNGQ
jgi:hypothetical protein